MFAAQVYPKATWHSASYAFQFFYQWFMLTESQNDCFAEMDLMSKYWNIYDIIPHADSIPAGKTKVPITFFREGSSFNASMVDFLSLFGSDKLVVNDAIISPSNKQN